MTVLSPVLHHFGKNYWITFRIALPDNPAHVYRRLPLRPGEVKRAKMGLGRFVDEVMERESGRVVHA